MTTASQNIQHESLQGTPAVAAGPLVVAMLYNRNGMATWCWEAAHALHELGRSVLLVAAAGAELPGTPAVEVVYLESEAGPARQHGRVRRVIANMVGNLAAGPDGVLQRIHSQLAARGVCPSAYILNQSTLVDRKVPCPQFVAAWSYPVTLFSYLRKVPLLAPSRRFKPLVRTALSTLGWWRKDWRGYRDAAGVLPVTEALAASLGRRSVDARVAYPGTAVSAEPARTGGGIRLLMAAVRLNEPRKRVLWMLDALKQLSPAPGTVLQLAGEADDSIRRAAALLSFPVEFLGRLQRQELQQAMQQAHVFCFGSVLDDWGYVLVEAMANGLVPVAPGQSPFDEILDRVGCCYLPHSRQDFLRAVQTVLSGSPEAEPLEAWNRARRLFSRASFGGSILESVDSFGHRC